MKENLLFVFCSVSVAISWVWITSFVKHYQVLWQNGVVAKSHGVDFGDKMLLFEIDYETY